MKEEVRGQEPGDGSVVWVRGRDEGGERRRC